MPALLADTTHTTGWAIGWTIGIVVVIVVAALALTIIWLAKKIGDQAGVIDDSLRESVRNTAALTELNTTIEHAEVIVAGLARGRARLGG